MKRKLLSLVLALALCLGLAVPALAAGGDFIIENGVLIDYTGLGGDVTIPDGVAKIGDEAFMCSHFLTSVTIPNSVTEIGKSAFSNDNLTSIIIPNSITKIGDSAFSYCLNLTNVAISSSVTEIGIFAFSDCTSLTSVAIPDSITKISDATFYRCTGLTNVTISSNVREIGLGAFSGCDHLTDVYYAGSQIQWDNIHIGNDNDPLTSATIHYGDDASSVSTAGGFTDVKSTDYFADAVQWAVEKGIAAGTGAGRFSPGQTCTVAQILTFLYRASGSPEMTSFNPFTDVGVNDYYYAAALWAYQNGLVSGSVFNPSAPCTRSMVVAYLWKLAGSPETAVPTTPTVSSLSYGPYTLSGSNTDADYEGYIQNDRYTIQFDAAMTAETRITFHKDYNESGVGVHRDYNSEPQTYDVTLIAVRPDSQYTIDGGFYGFSYMESGTTWISGVPGMLYFRASDRTFRYTFGDTGYDDTEFVLYEDTLSQYRAISADELYMAPDGCADSGVLIQLDGAYYFVTYADSAIAAGLLGSGGAFSDVPSSASYAQAVAWAVENGITTGDGANTFSPDKTCTRGQIVTFLHRAFA